MSFTVLGNPVPQGSMVALSSRTTGKVFMKAGNEAALKKWRRAIAEAAAQAWHGPPTDEPLTIEVWFYRNPPKSRTGASRDHTGPDIDKLLRAVLDGVTGVITTNDARFTDIVGHKRFTVAEPRAEISIARIIERPTE